MSHNLYGDGPPARHARANHSRLFPPWDEAQLQEELPVLRRDRIRLESNFSFKRSTYSSQPPPARFRCGLSPPRDDAQLQEELPVLRRDRVRLVSYFSSRRLTYSSQPPPARFRCGWWTAGSRIVCRRFRGPIWRCWNW